MAAAEKPVSWRVDLDSLSFQPDAHLGRCVVHRRAFRTLMASDPRPDECYLYFMSQIQAFEKAAAAKINRAALAPEANFHLTSRDLMRAGAVRSGNPQSPG